MSRPSRFTTALLALAVFVPLLAAIPGAHAVSASAPSELAGAIADDVRRACAAERAAAMAGKGAIAPNAAVGAYVRCAAPLFMAHLAGVVDVTGCSAPGPQAAKAMCRAAALDAPGLAPRLAALAEGCAALAEPLPAGCELAAGRRASQAADVEHVDTRLPGACSGNLTLLRTLPDEFDFSNQFGGTEELFDWTITRHLNTTVTTVFDFRCAAHAAIEGRTAGGFMRDLALTDGESLMLMCRYDGLVETGCTGTVESVEVIGAVNVYDPGGSGGAPPPAAARMSLDDGWLLINRGQGSTAAVQATDPAPVPVPAAQIDVEVEYTTHDLRGETESAHGPAAGALAALLVCVVAMRRRRL